TVASSVPVIVQQPGSQNVLPAATATLTVSAVGNQPLFYRWQKNGANLTDGENIAGSAASALIVSNAIGTATSTGAVLNVVSVSAPEIALTPVYSFTGGYDGGNPNGLALGADGNWHGTTQSGGTNSAGTIFQLNPTGPPVSLYSFTGTNDGATPFGTLAQGGDGIWYGTAFQGGAFDNGTVFRLTTNTTFT